MLNSQSSSSLLYRTMDSAEKSTVMLIYACLYGTSVTDAADRSKMPFSFFSYCARDFSLPSHFFGILSSQYVQEDSCCSFSTFSQSARILSLPASKVVFETPPESISRESEISARSFS